MDLEISEQTEALRRRTRALIDSEAPPIRLRNGTRALDNAEQWAAWKRWSARLYDEQLVGRNWPVEYGGVSDYSPMDDFIVALEIARARVLPHLFFATFVAHSIIQFGTEEQKRAFLLKTRSSEIAWCQLFSEPGAGSDLGSLRTRAERRGDVYIINGQKIWTTQAQNADFGFLLARTSTKGAKHAGITAFLIDMKQSGVVVRPIREITGTEDFNEVFFTDAVVPVTQRIGAENKGWAVAQTTLANERINVASYSASTRNALDDLIDLARQIKARNGSLPDGYRHRLVSLHAACQIVNNFGTVIATREQNGKPRTEDPLIMKIMFAETNMSVATFALELLAEKGLYAEGDPTAVDGGRWVDLFLYARTYMIAGGSSEVMRNVLAERVLAMPRDD
jgi:alkylation response protein AidB-like acyl-CoA dehydrogenase